MLSWSRVRGVLLGIVVTLTCHLIAIPTVVLVCSLIYNNLNLPPFHEDEDLFYGVLMMALAVTGVWLYQPLYILPLRRWCRHRRNYGMRQGIGITAIVTAVVSGYGFMRVLWYWYSTPLP